MNVISDKTAMQVCKQNDTNQIFSVPILPSSE